MHRIKVKYKSGAYLVPPASCISCLAVMMMLLPSTFTSNSSGLTQQNRVNSYDDDVALHLHIQLFWPNTAK
jgi:hypothetical protein